MLGFADPFDEAVGLGVEGKSEKKKEKSQRFHR